MGWECMPHGVGCSPLRPFGGPASPHAASPRVKLSCLLPACRRRQVLTDRVLTCLTDPAWTSLDLSWARQLSDRALQRAFGRTLPSLLALDLTGLTDISIHTFLLVSATCPRLHTLRIGGCPVQDEVAAAALPAILPRLEPARELFDDWEEAADAGGEGLGFGGLGL